MFRERVASIKFEVPDTPSYQTKQTNNVYSLDPVSHQFTVLTTSVDQSPSTSLPPDRKIIIVGVTYDRSRYYSLDVTRTPSTLCVTLTTYDLVMVFDPWTSSTVPTVPLFDTSTFPGFLLLLFFSENLPFRTVLSIL